MWQLATTINPTHAHKCLCKAQSTGNTNQVWTNVGDINVINVNTLQSVIITPWLPLFPNKEKKTKQNHESINNTYSYVRPVVSLQQDQGKQQPEWWDQRILKQIRLVSMVMLPDLKKVHYHTDCEVNKMPILNSDKKRERLKRKTWMKKWWAADSHIKSLQTYS